MVKARAFYTVDADKGLVVIGLTPCVNRCSWWDPAGPPFQPPFQRTLGLPTGRFPGLRSLPVENQVGSPLQDF